MIIFAYNFLHKKTQDFLFLCKYFDYEIEAVIAADWRELGLPERMFRTGLRPLGLIEPKEICKKFGYDFYEIEHNSQESIELLSQIKPEIGIISGARILKSDVINQFQKGIINFHPGLIPEVRGLHCLEWAIYDEKPLGITSHIISKEIDAGLIIKRFEIPEYDDDTVIDIDERLYQGQLVLFNESISMLRNSSDLSEFTNVNSNTNYYKSFPPEFQEEFVKKFLLRFPRSQQFQNLTD